MKTVGIREGKANLPALARAAAAGEPTLLTVHGKPIAVITAIPESDTKKLSDPSEFRLALLALPHDLGLDF